jgi:hypothetical protein
MMPFLKNRKEAGMSDPDDPIKRKPDGGEDAADFGIIDAIAEDMMEAHSKNDKALMKAALESLCDYIRDEDEEQDEQMEQA